MFLRLFRSRKHGRPATQFTLPDRWNKSFLQLERLDDRIVPAFLDAVNYAAGIYSQEVVTADFNNDGILDLAAAYDGSSIVIPDPGTGAVGVRLGNGDGTFGSAINSLVGHSPTSLAVGDFNGDGNLDLVTGDYNYGGTTTDVTVLLGNGNGSFQAPASIDLSYPGGYFGNGVESVAVGDFNADGKLDILAVANYYGVEFLNYDFNGVGAVLLGTGTGTFDAPQWSLLNPSYTTSAVVDDFNGDGKLDIASVSDGYYGSAGYLTVSLGNGDGTFGYRRVISNWAGNSLIASDLNNDGNVDLATTANGGYYGDSGTAVFLGTGTGSFGTPQVYSSGTYGLAAADFNGDGKIDLITASIGSNTVSVLLGDGAGAFTPTVIASVGIHPVGVAVGDFNDDGLMDAATANNASYNVSVLLNDGIWDVPPPPPPPTISISDVTKAEGRKGQKTLFTFTVTLSAASTETVTISYRTVNGTATTGNKDYIAKSGTITFAPGETEKTITIEVKGDNKREADEVFYLDLYNDSGTSLFEKSRGVGTVLNDD